MYYYMRVNMNSEKSIIWDERADERVDKLIGISCFVFVNLMVSHVCFVYLVLSFVCLV